MRPATLIVLVLCFFFVAMLGCGRTYQSIKVNDLSTQLSSYQGKRITIVGVPTSPRRGDFLPPTPLSEGYWMLIVKGIRCTETVNFENEPRIRSMLQMVEVSRKTGRPITVSGKVSGNILEMEFFEGIRTDTAWYKNKNPYYSYGEYYEWYPFAYSPNARVSEVWGLGRSTQ